MILDYFRQVFHLIFAISIMYVLLDCEISRKKSYYLAIFASIVIICDGFILLNFGYTFFMKLYPLLVHLPVFLGFAYISKFRPVKVLFVDLTVIVICTSFTSIGVIVSYFFDSSREVVNIVCYILYLPTWFGIYRYIRPTFLYMLRNTDKDWLRFCVIPLSYYILLCSIASYDLDTIIIERIIKRAVFYFILAFSAYSMIFRFFKQTREQLTMEKEQNLLKIQVAEAQVHLESIIESQEKTILYRHDMRHHMNLIDAYLADKNISKARKYIKDVENVIEDSIVERYCDNYSVNLILYSYITKAKNQEIEVETRIDLKEKNSISDMDLCLIFANAIENATNACTSISNVENRHIKIICNSKNNKLFIQITNTFSGVLDFIDGMPVSAEKDHGLGTKSIAAVAEKYGGICSFKAENGLFTTSIIV